MNTQIQSAIRSVLIGLLMTGFGYAVAKGLLTTDQVNALVPVLATAVTGVLWVLLGRWGFISHSPEAIADSIKENLPVAQAAVKAINSEQVPGVKVVSDASPSPQVVIDNKGTVKVDQSAQPKVA